MPEPTWLDVAVERFGEPAIAFPEAIIRFDLTRRCWVWFVDGHNYNLALDVDHRGAVKLSVNGPRRHVQLHSAEDLADTDIRAACAFAWPGYREATDG